MQQYLTQNFFNGTWQGALMFILLFLWPIPWKIAALWKASRNRQLGWFIAIFILNTIGILEIAYLTFFQKDKNGTGAAE